MVNETELTDEFEKKLKQLKGGIAGFERDSLDFNPDGPSVEQNARAGFTFRIQQIRRKINGIIIRKWYKQAHYWN